MNGIMDLLPALRAGEAVREIDDKLHEANLKVQSTGKAARVTIELAIEPVKNFEGAVNITDLVVAKLPEIKRTGGTILFHTADGHLSRKHPSQQELPGISLAAAAPEPAATPVAALAANA